MDKTEQYAEMVIHAVQSYCEKTVAPILAKLAEAKREIALQNDIINGNADELLKALERIAELEARPMAKAIDPEEVSAEVRRQISLIPPPEDGKSVDLGALFSEISGAVSRAVDAIPKPEKGDKGDRGDKGDKGDPGEISKGDKGEPGRNADPVDMEFLKEILALEVHRELATWPRPKDGLGLEGMSAELKEDGRTIVLKFSNGETEVRHEILIPWQIYRGIFETGKQYKAGDVVTFAGSQYTAKVDTTKPPKTPDWILSVKHG